MGARGSCGPRSLPIGVVLAGGRGRRIGGGKAVAQLCGRPMISYPLAALEAVLPEVVVLAKPETELPSLPSHTVVWRESESLQHPLVGLRTALELAGGRTVLVCAVDLPLVNPTFVRRLAFAEPAWAPAVVAGRGDAIQPLLGRYSAHALDQLRAADFQTPLRRAVWALEPQLLEVGDPLELFNVNTPADLARVAGLLCGPGRSARLPI
ncbi:MAG: molybdenum cofactor guanylyltransferase [Solirubrobacteraceae bacterium]